MTTLAYILLGLLGILALVAVVWRGASRRRSLPCPTWLSRLFELDNPFTETHRAAVIVERLELQPGMAVLDVGCGPGRVAIPIASKSDQTAKSWRSIFNPGCCDGRRRRRGPQKVANIRFLEAAVGEGKLPRDRFDRALLVTVLGEIPDRERALREIFDVLKPGGRLYVTEVIFDPHFQSRRSVARLAHSAGFRRTRSTVTASRTR